MIISFSCDFAGFVTPGPSNAALSCLNARQLCSEDPVCSQILEILPKVCGLELGKALKIQKKFQFTTLRAKRALLTFLHILVHFDTFEYIFVHFNTFLVHLIFRTFLIHSLQLYFETF